MKLKTEGWARQVSEVEILFQSHNTCKAEGTT